MNYAPEIPREAVEAATAFAAKTLGQNITARRTPFAEGDKSAHVWVFEVTGRHERGYAILGREMLVRVNLRTLHCDEVAR